VAKRKNQTIMEEVKAMIHDQDLPMVSLGRSMQHSSLHPEPVSSQDLGGQDNKGGIH